MGPQQVRQVGTVGCQVETSGADGSLVNKLGMSQAIVVPGGHLHPKQGGSGDRRATGIGECETRCAAPGRRRSAPPPGPPTGGVPQDIFPVTRGGGVLEQVVHHGGNVPGVGKVKAGFGSKESYRNT
jgi:hypothetical protein